MRKFSLLQSPARIEHPQRHCFVRTCEIDPCECTCAGCMNARRLEKRNSDLVKPLQSFIKGFVDVLEKK